MSKKDYDLESTDNLTKFGFNVTSGYADEGQT